MLGLNKHADSTVEEKPIRLFALLPTSNEGNRASRFLFPCEMIKLVAREVHISFNSYRYLFSYIWQLIAIWLPRVPMQFPWA